MIVANKINRYITVGIGKDILSIPIYNVVEIQEIESITPLPQTPSWLKGVINLRGDILSVVDLTHFLDMPAISITPQTKLIVLSGSVYQTAIIADSVLEVISIKDNEIEQIKDIRGAAVKIIRGVYATDEDLYSVLDVESFMADHLMTQFQ